MFSKFVLAGGVLLAVGTGASAATVSFTLDNNTGTSSLVTDVTLEDVAGGVKFNYMVNDPSNTGDIIAAYLGFAGAVPGDLTVDGYSIPFGEGVYAGTVVTEAEFNTSNVEAGNIGQSFDLGLQIGETGSGSDFYDSFTFTLFGTDLDISDFFGQTFAIRGQSVGCCEPPNQGGGSAKVFGTVPNTPDTPAVPLPAAAWLLAGGLSGLGALRAARRKA